MDKGSKILYVCTNVLRESFDFSYTRCEKCTSVTHLSCDLPILMEVGEDLMIEKGTCCVLNTSRFCWRSGW